MRFVLRLTACSGLAALTFSGLIAEAAASAPAGLDAVMAYAGTWKTSAENFETAHSNAGHDQATLHNACWKDGAYLACNQYVDGDSKILLVFTYDSKAKVYSSYSIPANGGDAGKGKLIIDGNVWTFPWQITENGATTYYRVVNTFTTPRRIEYRKEFSTDQVHWTPMAKGVTEKVRDE